MRGRRTDEDIIIASGLVRVKDEWKGSEDHQDGLKWVSCAPQPPKLR